MAVSVAIAHRIPAGWYPDRFDRTRRRWWDGVEWTDYYSPVPKPHLRLIDMEPSKDYSTPQVETTTMTHTLSGALRFNDRVPAFVLLGLVVANVVVLLILTRI